jgi:hypothetical protein
VPSSCIGASISTCIHTRGSCCILPQQEDPSYRPRRPVPFFSTWHPCSCQHFVPKIRDSGSPPWDFQLGLSAPPGLYSFWLHIDGAAIASCLLRNVNEYRFDADGQFPEILGKPVPQKRGCPLRGGSPWPQIRAVGWEDRSDTEKKSGWGPSRLQETWQCDEQGRIFPNHRNAARLHNFIRIANARRGTNDISVTRSFLMHNGRTNRDAAFWASRPGHAGKSG